MEHLDNILVSGEIFRRLLCVYVVFLYILDIGG